MKKEPELLGEYVRITHTSQIVRLKSYDSLQVEIECPFEIAIVTATFPRHRIESLTAEEEAAFLSGNWKGDYSVTKDGKPLATFASLKQAIDIVMDDAKAVTQNAKSPTYILSNGEHFTRQGKLVDGKVRWGIPDVDNL